MSVFEVFWATSSSSQTVATVIAIWPCYPRARGTHRNLGDNDGTTWRPVSYSCLISPAPAHSSLHTPSTLTHTARGLPPHSPPAPPGDPPGSQRLAARQGAPPSSLPPLRGVASRLPLDLLLEVLEQLWDGDASLLGRVALPQRHGAVALERVEVDGDAEGRARLVHAAVPPADGARGVVGHVVPPLQLGVELLGLGNQLRLVLE